MYRKIQCPAKGGMMRNRKRIELKSALAAALPVVLAIAGCGGDEVIVEGPLPDLVAGSIVVSPTQPVPTETINISATITNQGEAETPPTVPVRFSVDGAALETVNVGQLEPSESATLQITAGPFQAGGRTVDVTADPDGVIDEMSEDNNSAGGSFRVLAQPSLELNTPVTVSSSTVQEVLLFRVDITEPSDEALNIVLSGGAGDADLFVHYGDRPRHTDHYRCNSGNIDTNESCQMVPTRVGTYHVGVLAFSAFGPSNLVATVGGRPVKAFDIELEFLNNGTPSQDSIVRQAAQRWEGVMGREVQDWPYFQEEDGALPANGCFAGQPAVAEFIDDIRVWISIDSIDGVGNVVGSAGPCHVRAISYGFETIVSTPTVGAIILDEADVAQMESQGSLLSVVTHELAHVLGFGTIWEIRDWLRDPSIINPGADTHFIGPVTIPAFDAVGGGGYAGARVPVENGGEQGSADTHWRQSVFGDELMTPFLTGDSHPLSLVTVESMYDIWYEVDLNAADAFTLPSAGRAGLAKPRGPFIDLSNDVADWPIRVGDQKTGRSIKVIRPPRGR
ncbi:MAG: hypothetical protein F4139_06935 [Gemmatimonadetes bacterium]|nr:hypothetical protein [Gemmatimonadota bacterium]MYA64349.1 hypothetical protein [Gemmatimonadota bacterium]MYH52671.1 hypothetical protein [Gemmatimonadota bacterium]